MGLKSHYHVSQALTVAELSEHQSKKLVPAGEMLDITVTVILVNKTAELVIVQKLYQLSEYIFVLVHLTVNLIGCKITISNRRAFKTACKRLYFSDFKERLVHFNGTVVVINLFLIKCAGFQLTIVHGSTSFTTTEHAAMIESSPTLTPAIIITP